ncbi:MAG: ATP-binding cassette domain-containing protein [Treponema sp.]
MNSVCRVKDLRFAYKKEKAVLSGVSFSASANEIIGIIGKNGSGKSTLLNILAGFIKGYGGSVLINGADDKTLTLKERAKIVSYIPQKEITLPDYYTVEDFVMEGCRPFRNWGLYKPEDYENLDKVLADCKLTAFKTNSTLALSGGENEFDRLSAVSACCKFRIRKTCGKMPCSCFTPLINLISGGFQNPIYLRDLPYGKLRAGGDYTGGKLVSPSPN